MRRKPNDFCRQHKFRSLCDNNVEKCNGKMEAFNKDNTKAPFRNVTYIHRKSLKEKSCQQFWSIYEKRISVSYSYYTDQPRINRVYWWHLEIVIDFTYTYITCTQKFSTTKYGIEALRLSVQPLGTIPFLSFKLLRHRVLHQAG